MTLTVDLAPELDSRLQALAEANGVSVAEYVARLVEQAILRKRNEAAITLLSSWIASCSHEARGDPGYRASRAGDPPGWQRARPTLQGVVAGPPLGRNPGG